MLTRKIFFLSLLVLLAPCTCLAGGVIGLDGTISIPVLPVIPGEDPNAQIFNFFFTIMTLSGLLSVFFKNIIRLFRRNYD